MSTFFPNTQCLIKQGFNHARKLFKTVFGINEKKAEDGVLVLILITVSAVVYWLFGRLVAFFQGYTGWKAYGGTSFLFESVKFPEFTLGVLLFSIFLFYRWNETRWSRMNAGLLRWLILAVTLMLACYLGLSEYNYYWNRGFLADRFILLATGFGVVFHPFFLFPFLVALAGFYAQVDLPFGRFHTSFFLPLVYLSVVFFSHSLLFAVRRVRRRVLLFVMMSFIGATYFAPGVHKILASPNGLEWVLLYRLDYGAVQSFFLGWWWWNEDLFWRTVNFLETVQRPLIAGTLLLELGAAFIFSGRIKTLVLLAGFCLFHTVTFIVSGFFFWKLLVVLLFFGVVIGGLAPEDRDFLYHHRLWYLGTLLVVLAPIIGFYPTHRLVWWDTRYQVRFDLLAETSQNTHRLSYRSFSPYDESFGRGWLKLHQLINRPIILSHTKRAQTAHAINEKLRTEEDLNRLELEFGRNHFDSDARSRLLHFLKKYLINYRNRTYYQKKLDQGLRFLRPPRYGNHTIGPSYTHINEIEGKIQSLQILRVQANTSSNRLKTLRRTRLHSVQF